MISKFGKKPSVKYSKETYSSLSLLGKEGVREGGAFPCLRCLAISKASNRKKEKCEILQRDFQ